VGIAVIISNFIIGFYIYNYSINNLLFKYGLLLTVFLTIPFILFYFAKKANLFIQITHVIILLFASTFAIFDTYENIYGSAFWIIFYLLSYKYGFFRKYTLLKSIIAFIYLFFIIELSAHFDNKPFSGVGIIIFLMFFMTLLYFIYKAEIDRVLFSERKLETNIVNLILEKDQLQNKIESEQVKLEILEKEIALYESDQKPFNLDQCRLTPTELKIVKILTVNRATNREISEEMGIKESTVKQHFYRIFNKMGVDERYQIIDLCKYNYE